MACGIARTTVVEPARAQIYSVRGAIPATTPSLDEALRTTGDDGPSPVLIVTLLAAFVAIALGASLLVTRTGTKGEAAGRATTSTRGAFGATTTTEAPTTCNDWPEEARGDGRRAEGKGVQIFADAEGVNVRSNWPGGVEVSVIADGPITVRLNGQEIEKLVRTTTQQLPASAPDVLTVAASCQVTSLAILVRGATDPVQAGQILIGTEDIADSNPVELVRS